MHIPITAVSVPPRRQRKSMSAEKLKDLRDSLRSIGLLHPIVVRELPGENGPVYQLVCGERRFRAWQQLSEDPIEGERFNEIPATLIGELDNITRKQAELEENLLREDLTWQDRTIAIAELHSLRKEKNPEHTIRDTARELAEVQDRTINATSTEATRAVAIAKRIEQGDAVIANARSQREAYDILSRQLERDFAASLAEATGGKTSHVLLKGDMRELEWPSGIDVVIADPPYGVSADSFGDAGATHMYEDSEEYAGDIANHIAHMAYECTKESAHIYFFCDISNFFGLRSLFEKIGWKVFRTPIIWFKGTNVGHDPQPGLGFRRTYEAILFASKGNRPAKVLMEDVISVGPARNQAHAAAKPVELYRRLLVRSCNLGDIVLDPCCGSGTIFPAATATGTNAYGMEQNEEYQKIADARRYAAD